MQRIGIIVAGTHRSGTSALTRMLGSLGCRLPKTLLEPNEYNEAGYWESREVTQLNDAILESAGSSWVDWEAFHQGWYESPVADAFRDRARTVLENEFGDSGLFVLKDPRVCRLLKFWIDAMEDIAVAPAIVATIRNPLEVAGSLHHRDLIDPSIGLLLWLRNVLDAEATSREYPRAFVRYEELLDNWSDTAARLERELGVTWPKRSSSSEMEIETFLTPSHRHQAHDDDEIAHSNSVSRWVEASFEIVDRWSRGDVRKSDASELDSIRSALDEAGKAFVRPIVTGMRAGQENRALKTEIANLNEAIAGREEHIGNLNQAITDRDSDVSYLKRTVEDKDSQIELLDRTIADRDAAVDTLNRTIADREATVSMLNRTVADHEATVDTLNRAVADRDRLIEDFRSSTSWRITKPLRVLKPILVGMVRSPYRLLRQATVGILRLAWRLVPLGRSPKQRIKSRLLRSHFFRRLDRTPSQKPVRCYVSSGRVDLANQNHEAHKNQGRIPILFDPTYYLGHNEDIREAGIDPLTHYLKQGAVEGRLPIDIEPDDIDPMIRDLHRTDLSADGAFAFDPRFYRALYPDLSSLSDHQLANHYRQHGQAESRSGSMGEFVLQICDNPREIPLDFISTEYLDLYPDLSLIAGKSPLEALRHYMCHGRWEPRLHTLRRDGATKPSDTPSADLELPAELSSSERPLCVLAHVYYPELWDELSEYLLNLPEETYDLYVNLVDTSFSQALVTRIRDSFPSARIYISENIGRDIGGFCQLLRHLRMNDYRLFCLVHTKQSPHMAKGEVELWRRKLLTPLMGTRECAVENIRLMLSHEEIGLLGSRQCRYTELNDNPQKYFELLNRLGIDEASSDVEFLSGTMMFLRRKVLQRMVEVARDLPFENGEERSIEYHRDGQWAHAVERAFGAVVRDMNYRIEWR